MPVIKTCLICGKEFEARGKGQKYCRGPHHYQCKICGKEFEFNGQPRDVPNTCSSECKKKYRVIKLQEKYGEGVINVSQIPEVREKKKISNASAESQEKLKQTCLEKYGVERANQSPEVRKKLSDALKSEEVREKTKRAYQERYGVDHIFADKEFREKYGADNVGNRPEVKEKVKQTLKERYGVDSIAQIPGVADKAKETRKNTFMKKYGKENVFQSDEFKEFCLKKYGYDNPSKSPEIRSLVGQARKLSFTDDGTCVDSSYEKEIYNFCLRNNIDFEYQNSPLHYEYNNKNHITIIDFCIDGILIEGKGGHLINGLFDYDSSIVPIKIKLDLYSKNDVIVVTDSSVSDKFGKPNSTESNGLKYKNKCPNPLIGIDIELFKKHPKFPYDKNKPEVFYQVKVNDDKSVYDAFYNEQIRWKMIKNRILYSGGFIDAKQVLNALNITMKC